MSLVIPKPCHLTPNQARRKIWRQLGFSTDYFPHEAQLRIEGLKDQRTAQRCVLPISFPVDLLLP